MPSAPLSPSSNTSPETRTAAASSASFHHFSISISGSLIRFGIRFEKCPLQDYINMKKLHRRYSFLEKNENECAGSASSAPMPPRRHESPRFSAGSAFAKHAAMPHMSWRSLSGYRRHGPPVYLFLVQAALPALPPAERAPSPFRQSRRLRSAPLGYETLGCHLGDTAIAKPPRRGNRPYRYDPG